MSHQYKSEVYRALTEKYVDTKRWSSCVAVKRAFTYGQFLQGLWVVREELEYRGESHRRRLVAREEEQEQQVQRDVLVHYRVGLVELVDHEVEEIHGPALGRVPALVELLLQYLHDVLASLHALVEGCPRNAERERQQPLGPGVEAFPQASSRRRVVVADQLLRRDGEYHLHANSDRRRRA